MIVKTTPDLNIAIRSNKYWQKLPAADYINQLLTHYRTNSEKWQDNIALLSSVRDRSTWGPVNFFVENQAGQEYLRIVAKDRGVHSVNPDYFGSMYRAIWDLTRVAESNSETYRIRESVVAAIMALIAWPEKSMQYFDMDPERLLLLRTLTDDPAAIVIYTVVVIMHKVK
jgi:hypothetical protein